MRIAVDFRVLSTEAADRGMGRYTQQQLREVLRIDKENRYFVVCQPSAKKSLILPEIRFGPNVEIIEFASSFTNLGLDPNQEEHILRYSYEYQEFLFDLELDLYHSATPFIAPVIPKFDVCPMVATLFDLIPMVYPKEYLPSDSDSLKTYKRALFQIDDSTRLIAISESAKRDAIHYLGYPPDRIDVAYPIIAEVFKPADRYNTRRVLESLRTEIGLPEQFILSVTGIHNSKNLDTLLQAYGRLATSLKNEYPLVIVLPTETAYKVFQLRYGNLKNVVVIHSVSDAELAALYNEAVALIHPSRYEGFGYPAAEAMACGTPVIMSSSSSLPEIAGTSAIMVDPDDIAGFAKEIVDLLNSEDKRHNLGMKGISQAKKFSPQQLGDVTYTAYLEASNAAKLGNNEGKPRVAIWSSFPPQKCGVGDYTAELVEEMNPLTDLEIFVDDGYLPDSQYLGRYRIQHFASFERRNLQEPFDILIYQMGATYYQEFMYEMILKRPGIIVLHDLSMALGFYFLYANRIRRLRKDIIAPEGKDVLEKFDKIRKIEGPNRRELLEKLFDEHYLLQWILDNSLAQIVHMQSAKEELEERYGDTNVYVVTMGVSDPWRRTGFRNEIQIREKYGIPLSTFLIGVFGIVDPVKRIESCISALEKIGNTSEDNLLLVVGRQHDDQYMQRLHQLVQELGVQENVIFLDYLPRDDFDNLMLASDVIVNLRFPTRKGMSAILIRAIAAGKPVIISDVDEWQDFPGEICWRVAPNENEVVQLSEQLSILKSESNLRKNMSRAARKYYLENATLVAMAQRYIEVIGEVISNQG